MPPPNHPEPPFDTPGQAVIPDPTSTPTLTVSQLNRLAKRVLESHFDFVWIEGELSNLATPGSGHWYFSLKDESAQVRCAMFRNRNTRVRFRPANGQQVRLRARVSLYEGRGEFQLIVEHLEEAGAGALQRAFEALKLKLAAEGLFDAERKRPLPAFPRRVAIISSRTGAAVHDIITVFRRRFPAITLSLLPVSVQGETAAAEACAALASIDELTDVEAVIVARGGGSAEDLWAFNDEALARAIADCPVPVVSAIGHETDFTITDFVADHRAPTPSAAAELLSPDQRELATAIAGLEADLARRWQRKLLTLQTRLKALRRQLRHPGDRLREQAQRLDDLELRLARAARFGLVGRAQRLARLRAELRHRSPTQALSRYRQKLEFLGARSKTALLQRITDCRQALALGSTRLDALSPLNTLERGYTLVTDDSGQVLTSAARLSSGQRMTTRFRDGRVTSEVIEVEPVAGLKDKP